MDLLAISYDDQGNIYLNRERPGEGIIQSIKISRHEAITGLIPSMANQPELAEKMLGELMRLNIARPNHGPDSPIL